MKRILSVVVLLVSFAALEAPTAHAQFFYFGRNKVQYTAFEWHVLRTEHFDIYYYPEMQALAERGAFFAEEACKRLELRFNHSLNARVPLIFYSSHLHFQQTNTTGGFIPEGVGGFFEFLKGRVVIPSDGSTAQFRHVIDHELVHVFMHSKLARVLTDHRKVADRMPPLWFTEGLAEFWSTKWDTQADMVMRDAVLSGIVVGLNDMDRIYGSFLMYKEGQNALQYIAKTYGDEKILLLMENFWKETSFNLVLQQTIGKTYKEFDEEWLYALKKQYFPLYASEDSPSRAAKPIVMDGFNSKPVVFEHDSVRDVYFIGNKTGYSGIYKKQIDPPEQSESFPSAAQSAWAQEPAENVIEGEKTDEFEAFHLLRGRIDVSKEGVLAFVTKSGENDAIHLYDVVRNSLIETFRFKSLVGIGSASWAPDGKRITFTSIDKAGNNDLYVFNTETRELTRLTNDYYDERDPAWSPDGRRIAFASDRTSYGTENKYNLFVYDVASGAIEYLTYGPDNYLSPSWSKDGKRLAFTSDAGGAQNIWLTDVSKDSVGSFRSITKITQFTTAAFDPAWTSDGDIVFTAFEKFSFQIRYLKNVGAVADTSSITQLIDLNGKQRPWQAKTLVGATSIERFKYVGDYSLDIAQSAISTDPVFGTSGGAAVALSDLLGNDQYYFLLYNTAQTQDELLSSFNLAISRISLKQRTSFAYGIYRFTGRRYDLTDKDEFFYERVFGGYFALSYPLTKFQRIEASVSLSNSNKDADLRLEDRKALLLSNSLAFVHDNSLWGPSGPLDGSRFSLTLAYTSDIQYSNVNYYSVIFDYRNYLRLSQRSAFASRFWLWYNGGKEARRFVLGGSWDLRGFPRWSIRGEKLWLTSQELRFPFLDALGLQFPFGGVLFSSIRGALFFDAGSAWDNTYNQTYGSFGGGLRMNFGGVLVLRYDIGKRIENNFARLQDGIFHQFFFGWDF
ncbi:MAG: PD40 domain-containing protein [Ignavibacteriae bacterium]|nr:PD40 domain-containing protein [Ignavibacteriota bacterium]